MQGVIDWTYLPWEQQGLAGNICWLCLLAGVLFGVITQLIRRTSLGYDLHGAPFLTMEGAGYALLLNTAIYALFFWYVAWAVSLFFSWLFYVSVRGIQGRIYYEEKDGRWGLYPPLRQIRGEMFSDLSVEEQLQYKQEVDRRFRKVNPLWYFPLTVLLPFGIILLLRLVGLPYLFVPHAL